MWKFFDIPDLFCGNLSKIAANFLPDLVIVSTAAARDGGVKPTNITIFIKISPKRKDWHGSCCSLLGTLRP
jgi:hypothetical protein